MSAGSPIPLCVGLSSDFSTCASLDFVTAWWLGSKIKCSERENQVKVLSPFITDTSGLLLLHSIGLKWVNKATPYPRKGNKTPALNGEVPATFWKKAMWEGINWCGVAIFGKYNLLQHKLDIAILFIIKICLLKSTKKHTFFISWSNNYNTYRLNYERSIS